MKRSITVLAVFALLLALTACGHSSAPDQQDAPSDGITALDEVYTAPSAIEGEDVQCTALQKDGAVYGFELRFRQSQAVDTLLRTAENYYYGVLTCGKKAIPVPTEEIRIVTDIETHSFVVTLLLPKQAKLSGKECAVSLCIAPRESEAQTVLFCVTKAVPLA